MRRTLLLALMLVTSVVLVGAAASTVNAQNQEPVPVYPPRCEDIGAVDLNGDGKLTGADFTLWVVTVHESGLCELDAPLGQCPDFVDVNGDGIVSHADLNEMFLFLFTCVYPPMNHPFVLR